MSVAVTDEQVERAVLSVVADIPMPRPITAHFARIVGLDACELQVKVGGRDRWRKRIGGRTAALDRHVLIEAANEAVAYAFHVRECYEGIRDLVDQ